MSKKRTKKILKAVWLEEKGSEETRNVFRYAIRAQYYEAHSRTLSVHTVGAPRGYRTMKAAEQRACKNARNGGLPHTALPIKVADYVVGTTDMRSAA